MTETTIELPRKTLKKILEMHSDATGLLEAIPEMQDQGRISEASQHIGAELEARVTEMNKAEKQVPAITELLEEIQQDHIESTETLSDLEEDVLGDQ